MSKPLQLDDFSATERLEIKSQKLPIEKQEEIRLAAYEQGYKAGWEDCVAANESDQTRISEELASNLNELSFTYHEARSSVLKSLEPVLKKITGKVLPSIAMDSFGDLVVQKALALANGACDVPVEIVASSATLEKITPSSSKVESLPLQFVEEPSLGVGQVFLRFGASERQIDVESVFEGINEIVDGLFEEDGGLVANG
ncbi:MULTISPECIES: flagellar biosynthesis protein [Halocynthiibacter]|uniref:Flagellar biosynthesis protein n=1 Tax=Halocynthiibacter halioticoli TaxID=2986804 RepID=A0AAE3IW53_9RHOB|nr:MULTISPECIES: flagellar biosynthesis protein [Halocynthiibacter]MCV6823089.1 flagellar biosynthesis protein [Halocynthiibacter halioticoli]MCW4056090.1 flagellar biosynthesis protein [Halocynthiibacter sp. SDUM655004]